MAVAAVVVVRGRGGESEAAGGTGGAAAGATPSPSPTPTTPPPKVWVASAGDPVRVWVGGDSMGGELGWALEPVLQDARAFKPVTFYKESSGICRYDFFDWQQQIETVVKAKKPQAAVIMMGTNDTQSVWMDGDWIPYGKMAWKQAYERRVGDIIDTLLEGGARRVYWVGMPIMGEDWRNSRMRLINRIFQKQSEKRPGAEYVDIWDLYTTSDGSFDASLRLADQVHFTAEGQAAAGRDGLQGHQGRLAAAGVGGAERLAGGEPLGVRFRALTGRAPASSAASAPATLHASLAPRRAAMIPLAAAGG